VSGRDPAKCDSPTEAPGPLARAGDRATGTRARALRVPVGRAILDTLEAPEGRGTPRHRLSAG